jgi:hypothetical protein
MLSHLIYGSFSIQEFVFFYYYKQLVEDHCCELLSLSRSIIYCIYFFVITQIGMKALSFRRLEQM